MAFYIGVVRGTIDASGITILPAPFCGEGMWRPGSCIATYSSFKQALMLYSRRDWEHAYAEIIALPMTQESEHIKRIMLGHGTASVVTSQRELIIQHDFRDYAKLVEDIVFIGCRQFIEIVSADCGRPN